VEEREISDALEKKKEEKEAWHSVSKERGRVLKIAKNRGKRLCD